MPVEVDTVRAVSVPTRLVHGPGAVSALAREVAALGVSRPMLVTDPGVSAAGLVDRVLPQLDGAAVFDEVRPNPDIELVDRAADAYRDAGCDGLVALGGGSSIDAAKSIGVVAAHGGSIAGYEWGRDPNVRRIPFHACRTTSPRVGGSWPAVRWACAIDDSRRCRVAIDRTPARSVR